MKVLPGGCLKYLCAFHLRVVLFSLPLLGGFCRGCPCVPCWIWSSPVGDGENNDRCVRELGTSVVPWGQQFCSALGGMWEFGTYVSSNRAATDRFLLRLIQGIFSCCHNAPIHPRKVKIFLWDTTFCSEWKKYSRTASSGLFLRES